MTSRQAEWIGWAMSACSLARPSAARMARFSSSFLPHWLQWRDRRWFLEPQVQRSVSLRLGIATNEPLVPSMIFRSRTTKASSNVTEQNACRRSFSLPSSMSLIRTSVMTTVVLLFSVAHSIATPNDQDTRRAPFLPNGAPGTREEQGLLGRTAQGKDGTATPTHQPPGGTQAGESPAQLGHRGAQPFGRR